MKNTSLLVLTALIIVIYTLNSTELSADPGTPPDLQPGFMCSHNGEYFFSAINQVGDWEFCRDKHNEYVAAGIIRHDKGSSADRCQVTHDPFN